jgi:hypothetical protein
MAKCNGLFQDKQEQTMREQWEKYCEDSERFLLPHEKKSAVASRMSFNDWVADYADDLKDRAKYE